MTVKILLSIIALALSVCASAKIDYADYKKLQDAYQIPAPEAEKLSESGNPYAKLRSALDNIPYEREKSVSEIRELYEKRGLRLAGYYLSNFLKDKAEREKLLEKLAAEGGDYACSAAKCDLLFDNLKASSDAADAKKFNASFDSLLSLAKDGFQPAAVKLAFFIETNCGKIKNFRDAAAELPALYGILSRASKEMEFYQMKRGEALALCAFFSQAGGYNSEPHGHIPDNIGTIVVESSNREKLVIRNGELQIISTIDWEWENSTRAAISAIKASQYFRDPGEDPASALSGLSADGISSEPRAQQADY